MRVDYAVFHVQLVSEDYVSVVILQDGVNLDYMVSISLVVVVVRD